MRVLGIDPGYNIVGFGVVESNGNKVIDYGVITTPKEMPMSERHTMQARVMNNFDFFLSVFLYLSIIIADSQQTKVINRRRKTYFGSPHA